MIDNEGTVWVHAGAYYNVVSKNNGQNYVITQVKYAPPGDAIWEDILNGNVAGDHQIFKTRNGRIWIGQGPGLVCRDPRAKEFSHHYFWRNPTSSQYMWWDYVRGILERTDATFWFGTLKGLALFDLEDERFSWHIYSPGNPMNLPEYGITKL